MMSCWRSVFFIVVLVICQLSVTMAAVYRHPGPCLHKDTLFSPGQTFRKGCDKCYCHENGFVCLSPMKPTSWPQKCQRVHTECGYRVVYRNNPELDCRPYSWIW